MPDAPPTRTAMRGLALLALLVPGLAALAAGGLATEIERLSAEHGFAVKGIGRIGPEPAPAAPEGDLLGRLRVLLGGYNHVVEGTPEKVTRVIILGHRAAGPPPRRVVRTTRRRGHHLVQASVQGPSATPVSLSLLLDTGASSVVLPESLIGTLGFEPGDLVAQRSQTVNGTVDGRAGILARVRVGGASAEDVAVLFVPDERLGGVMLLGMSFLGNFAFSVDDAAGQLVLTPR